MDRTVLAACAGLVSLLGGGLTFAWHGRAADGCCCEHPAAAQQPALLDARSLERPTWKPLATDDRPVAPTPLAIPAAHRPPVEVALPPLSDEPITSDPPVVEAAKPLAAAKNPVRRPVVEAAKPLVIAGEEQGVELEGVPEAELQEPKPVAPEVAAGPIGEDALVVGDEATHSLLPWAHANPNSPEMRAVLCRANDRLRHGFLLARRGATYSARMQFIGALQMIAEANDEQQNTRLYTTALSSGLTALREAGVFVRHSPTQATLAIDRIVAGHKTEILKDADLSDISATEAANRYYVYAEEQLAAAAAREALGSMALFAMAKAAASPTTNSTVPPLERTAQAMTLYKAALLAEPHNFLAANELAVLEVKNGNLLQARELLVQSAKLSNQPATWHNLVAVHSRLGETELAEQARQRLAILPQMPNTHGLPPVEWLDADAFARTAGPATDPMPVPPGVPAQAPAPAPASVNKPRENVAKRGLTDWLPWNSRR